MLFKQVNLHIKNDEGSGLVLALMTLLVLSVLGASLGAVTVGSFKLGDVNRDDTSAYYIAEAGASQTFEEIKIKVLDNYDESKTDNGFFDKMNLVKAHFNDPKYSEKLSDSFDDQFGDSPKVSIEVILENAEGNTESYLIKSTGQIGGRERLVTKHFDVTWVEETVIDYDNPEEAALISKGNIDFKPNAAVHDNVIVSNLNNVKVNGKTKSNPSQIKGNISSPISNWDDYESLAKSFPDVSKFTTSLTTDYIDSAEEDDLYYYTDNLDLSKLNINGNGVVNILIKDNLYFNGDEFNLNNDFKNVRLFYAGDKIEISKDYKFNASLFVKDGNISIGNKVSFNGVLLYGGEKEIEIGVHDELLNSYLIAPFAHVTVRNHAEISGTLIAKSVDIDNQSNLYFKSIDDFPFLSNGTGSGEEGSGGEVITSEPVIESE